MIYYWQLYLFSKNPEIDVSGVLVEKGLLIMIYLNQNIYGKIINIRIEIIARII